MRPGPGLLLALLVVLAGCNGLAGTDPPTAHPASGSDTVAADDDPLGFEDGVWYNETLAVSYEDGLNETERELVVARTMARIEHVRGKEFTETVEVEIISREEFRESSDSEYNESFRTFDNTKFEALHVVGEDRDALADQQDNQGSNVLGFYDPSNDTIKLVADGDQPTIDGEGTLAHELVHALQDQYHNLSSLTAETRDGVNGQNALIEGEALFVQRQYTANCGAEWDCAPSTSGGGGGDMDLNWGIYLLKFFPYSDGPGFVAHLHDEGGWDAVDRAFDDPPTSAEQVIYPDRYIGDRDQPTDVSLADSAGGDWERVRPPAQSPSHERPDHARLGQSALGAMFAATLFDDRNGAVIDRNEFLTNDGNDPFDYDLDATDGWEGDRLHVYDSPTTAPDETAYVWRIEWESAAEAREFAETYRDLLVYQEAEPTSSAANVFVIPEGTNGFSDAFYIDLDGDTVTIVNAPTVDDISDVYDRR